LLAFYAQHAAEGAASTILDHIAHELG